MNEATFFPKAITVGTKVQLKNEAFKDVRVREWQFSAVNEGKIVLSSPQGFILKVKLEDIDWQVHNKLKSED